jgi:hypothetical protein
VTTEKQSIAADVNGKDNCPAVLPRAAHGLRHATPAIFESVETYDVLLADRLSSTLPHAYGQKKRAPNLAKGSTPKLSSRPKQADWGHSTPPRLRERHIHGNPSKWVPVLCSPGRLVPFHRKRNPAHAERSNPPYASVL